MRYKSTLDGLIECMQNIRQQSSGDIPVCISLVGDRNLAIQNIYYEKCTHNEGRIYLDADYEETDEYLPVFSLVEYSLTQNK